MDAPRRPKAVDGPEVFAQQFNVSRETVEKLDTYAGLLKQWQKTINLVSPGTLDAVWHRHIADSAQLLNLAPASARRWVDLGSGAGFPGLVIAILLKERPGIRVTLVESDTRKVAFLREVARQTALASVVDICHARIEIASTQIRVGLVDVVTARALAPLHKLLGLCQPFFGPSTVALLLKGREAEREAEDASADWQFEAKLVPSVTDSEARIAVITKLQAHSR
jgi:16S rRNA (guanine527-N7)-methyltransferase